MGLMPLPLIYSRTEKTDARTTTTEHKTTKKEEEGISKLIPMAKLSGSYISSFMVYEGHWRCYLVVNIYFSVESLFELKACKHAGP